MKFPISQFVAEALYWKTMVRVDDGELIAAYLAGDREALERLFLSYLHPVYRFVKNFVWDEDDAADIAQDVFLRAWSGIRSFDTSKKFSTWIFEIAKNTSLNWLQKKRPHTFSALNSDEDGGMVEQLEDGGASPEEILDFQLEWKKLENILGMLSPLARAVVLLRVGEELEFHEIAERMGESLDTVKSRYRRAISRLKEKLGVEDAPNRTSRR